MGVHRERSDEKIKGERRISTWHTSHIIRSSGLCTDYEE
jgi:hypothetical protein